MKFTFSEQGQSAPQEHDRREPAKDNSFQGQDGTSEELERLKEDAPAYGWEFDETKGVFQPLSAF